jgi:hypothetical protein
LTEAELEREACEDDEESDWFYADFVQGGRLTPDGLPTHWMPLPAPPTNIQRRLTMPDNNEVAAIAAATAAGAEFELSDDGWRASKDGKSHAGPCLTQDRVAREWCATYGIAVEDTE